MTPRRNLEPYEELFPGSTLGKYEILRKLATGGMAEIYLARARGVAGFEKTVVLKRILPHVAEDEGFVQMFLDEARLAATLQHPNIADVYDVGETNGTPFFTMEYVHGQDARSIRAATRKRGEQVPIAMALAIVHGTASALDYAHERTGPDGKPLELVHRDVSASNIIVSYDGAIKLLDFGIARAASHQHKTQIGALKGKTPYMSPEQCRAQRIDRRSDLFSLGTVMFELTVGHRPFRGENDFAVMEQIVHGEAPRPSALVPGYPLELEAIVMKLLARDVAARYQTAEELLHELEQLISKHGLWVSSRPLGKYMRLLFAERIAAWERAASEGVTLSEHVAETITSESQRSEPFTPHSGGPQANGPQASGPQASGPRLLRLSQEFPAVSLPSQQMAAVQPPEEAAFSVIQTVIEAPAFDRTQPVRAPGAMPLPGAAIGAVEPAGGGTLFDPPLEDAAGDMVPGLRASRLPLLAAVLVLLAGAVALVVYAWPVLFPDPAAPETSRRSPAPPQQEPPAAEPAAAPPAGPPAAAAPASTAEPPTAPAATTAVAEPPTVEPPTAEPPTAEPPPAEPPPAEKRPAATRRPPPKPPAKAPPRVPSANPPEDDAWNQDSPFLPPSS